VSLTANYVERILLLPSLYYCAENAGDEMVIMRSRKSVLRTVVMESGSESCQVVGW